MLETLLPAPAHGSPRMARSLDLAATLPMPSPQHRIPAQRVEADTTGRWVRLLALAVFAVGSASAAWAQGSAPSAETRELQGPKLERIVVEDAGSRVEESRVGGVTRQIEVQPKVGGPAYQIQPSQVQGPATSASERTGQPGGAGRSSWRVLSF